MSAADSKATGRSAAGQSKRQQIIDHMHAVGVPCDAGMLLLVTGETERRTMTSRLQRMLAVGEVSRKVVLVDGHLVHFFTPLVETTTAKLPPGRWALSCAARRPTEGEWADEDVPAGPWHTIHRCSDKHPPIKGQRGQCETRPRCASVMASL